MREFEKMQNANKQRIELEIHKMALLIVSSRSVVTYFIVRVASQQYEGRKMIFFVSFVLFLFRLEK